MSLCNLHNVQDRKQEDSVPHFFLGSPIFWVGAFEEKMLTCV